MPTRVLTERDRKRRAATRVARCVAAASLLAFVSCGSEPDPSAPARQAAGHPTSQVADVNTGAGRNTLTTRTAMQSVPAIDCAAADCHQDLFQVAYRHAPVQAGACDSCHAPEQPEHKFPLQREGVEACTFCHPVIGQKEHLHAVIEKQGCLPCHDPHGSNAKFLLTAPGVELTCRKCHEIERRAHLHGPFASGQCTACHQAHESDNRFLLLGGAGSEHCFLCHQAKAEQLRAAKTVHQPVADGCAVCHVAHSSDFDGLLAAPIEELCLACHAQTAAQVTEATVPHSAVSTGRRCANCHEPHGNDRPFLLWQESRTLCLGCHDQPQKALDGRTIPDMRPELLERKFLHGPVQTGQCNACHEVHGSRNVRLLRKYYTPEFYAAFDLANYALCFECHNSAAVLRDRTTSETNFRDGEVNLHFVHVNRKEKGRTCRTCHEAHGSDLPQHMASAVPFEGGGWAMPIGFRQTADGGRCSPACHGPREYRRQPRPLDPAPAGNLNERER
jgi:predicted CXXCH cytochrome family protein